MQLNYLFVPSSTIAHCLSYYHSSAYLIIIIIVCLHVNTSNQSHVSPSFFLSFHFPLSEAEAEGRPPVWRLFYEQEKKVTCNSTELGKCGFGWLCSYCLVLFSTINHVINSRHTLLLRVQDNRQQDPELVKFCEKLI